MSTTNTTRIVTGEVRLSYAHVWEPNSIQGGKPKYSVSLIIPKSDTATIAAIEKAVDAAIEAGTDEAYKGAYFLNANSLTAPQIVDQSVAPILDRAEVYSGCYARVSLSFYAFNTNGNRGIACGLGNIQKTRDGESLGGGRVSAETDFGAFAADDDFLN
ncbi:MAG: DUF2815 family protein [Actinomyces sp.]|nr:DUF2815 family protein [Actinomyces sp.]